jgi:phosphoesterase RecJ-like protein
MTAGPTSSARAEAVRLVREGKRFLCTCHVMPDADALGSALGFAAILRTLGKEALVWSRDPVNKSLRFLPGSADVVREIPAGVAFDATFVFDTASRQLLPKEWPASAVSGPVVMVDHHAAHDAFGDVVVREVDAVAAGEVAIRLAAELGVREFGIEAAKPLYAALVADTGGFRYAGTSPETLRLGARLLEVGVDPWEVAYNLFEGWPKQRLTLLGSVLETLETHADGKIAILRVSRAMLARTRATDEMVEGLVNYARMLEGVEVAALLWERDPERGADGALHPVVKVSLRAHREVDVSQIAVALGGGGHRAAAGANVDGTLDECRDLVVREALQRV